MADLRYDPINDLWVAVAEVRTERPNEYRPRAEIVPLDRCPFCRGHEAETPSPIAEWDWDSATHTLRPASVGQWLVRAIPNRYPAFSNSPAADDDLGLRSIATNVAPYRSAHSQHSCQELVLESARHVESYSQLNDAELFASFFVYRQRLAAFQQNKHLRYALLFKNCRPEAGASLAHIHSQLFGLDYVPAAAAARKKRLGRVDQVAQSLMLKRVADFEIAQGERLVAQGEDWTVVCPYASRFGFQTWIVPRRDWGPQWRQTDSATMELARLVRTWTMAIEQLLDRPAYNVLFHNPPLRGKELPGHCYIELFARIGNVAGFEWGSNCWINTHSPEAAASTLREKFQECDW
ncbi:MAG: DUF4921 family protein [Planctomycetaceae bacterium]|nr:DUF4921 family protein [Planctomycetaceae bacterium]